MDRPAFPKHLRSIFSKASSSPEISAKKPIPHLPAQNQAHAFGPPAVHGALPAVGAHPTARIDPLKTSPAGTYTSTLNPAHRIASLERMEHEELEVLVIGGGVTGAGAALDAASRGKTVGLVEAADFASGTSSRSSKLIHGGLRYLEQFNFGLVKEALRERSLLLQTISPHLVHPVKFLFPLKTRVIERPYVGAGLALYDSMGGAKALPGHKHVTRTTAFKHAPALREDALIGGIEYYDAQVDDARQTLALARTAAQQGAAILTDTKVEGFIKEGNRVVGARVFDQLTGRRFNIRAKNVINATGVWSGEVQDLAGEKKDFKMMASKGIHIVVPKDRLDLHTGLILRTEKSVLFVIPWGNHWLIGTTDTKYELHNKEHPAVSSQDIDYVLERVNAVLKAPLTRDDIEGAFAGLRPLVTGADSEDGATTKISREHHVSQVTPGLTVVNGGKLTTYRVMAKDAVDMALTGTEGEVPASCTENIPLVGAAGYAEAVARREALATSAGLSLEQIDHLLGRYGGETVDLLKLIAQRPELGRPLPGAEETLEVEAVFAVSFEGALHLDDVLTRRTRVSIQCRDRGVAAAEPVARRMAEVLGWSEATIQEEVTRYKKRVEKELESYDQPDDVSADEARRAAPSRKAALAPLEKVRWSGLPVPSAQGRPLILAHRGSCMDAPENTMAAFRLALEQGADGFEFDVRLTGDGKLLVAHDNDLTRLAGSELVIRETSYERLSQVDVGSFKGPQFAQERMPLFSQVLEEFPQAIKNVELKPHAAPGKAATDAECRAIGHAAALALADVKNPETLLVSSFEPRILAAFREKNSQIATSLLYDEDTTETFEPVDPGTAARQTNEALMLETRSALGAKAGAIGINPHQDLITEELAKRAADAGRPLYSWIGMAGETWSEHQAKTARSLAARGVAAIITNWPDKVRKALAA